MTHAVSRRFSLTAEARLQSQPSPVGVFGGQRVTGIHISVLTLVYLYQYHIINDLYSSSSSKLLFHQKMKKKKEEEEDQSSRRFNKSDALSEAAEKSNVFSSALA